MASRGEALILIGTAMQNYAGFEFGLFNLVDLLLETKREKAAAIFYSLKSARDRNSMLERLLGLRFGEERKPFRKSLIKWINITDETRNRLAHGLLLADYKSDPPQFYVGRPVEYWIPDWPLANPLTMTDIDTFITKTGSLSEIIRRFTGVLFLDNGMPENLRAEWSAGCEQAFELPLPDGHPLKPAN